MTRWRALGLRAQLVLAAAYLLVAVLIAIEVPFALSVQRRAVQELISVEVGYASLLASQVSGPVARSAASQTAPVAADPLVTGAVGRVTERVPTARVLIVDARRRVLHDTEQTPLGTVLDISQRPELASALGGTIVSAQRFSSTLGEDLLLVAVPIFQGTQVVGAARISQELAEVQRDVRRAWLGLGGVGLAALLVGLGLAWLLATAVVRPVRQLEGVAARFGAGEAGARAEPTGTAEVASLAGSFNRMADAVSANLRAQQDFVANASHQLRTPVTGLRLRLEAIEAEGGEVAAQAAKAQVEVERLTRLVEDLLALARASSVESTGTSIDLAEAAGQATDRWTQAAEAAGQRISHLPGRTARVWADPADVEHILDNLIENSIRYCPPGAAITVESGTRDGRGLLAVADDGPGIATADQDRVFERFYRGSTGRQSGPGTGLGLAIVAQLAARWGGSVRLVPTRGEQDGTRIEVAFPPVPAARRPTIS